jgi:hypothetical protein
MVTAKINGQWHEAGYESKEEAEKVADALEQDYCLPPEDVKITMSRTALSGSALNSG